MHVYCELLWYTRLWAKSQARIQRDRCINFLCPVQKRRAYEAFQKACGMKSETSDVTSSVPMSGRGLVLKNVKQLSVTDGMDCYLAALLLGACRRGGPNVQVEQHCQSSKSKGGREELSSLISKLAPSQPSSCHILATTFGCCPHKHSLCMHGTTIVRANEKHFMSYRWSH